MSKRKAPLKKRVKNLSLAAIAGQAGCITLLIVFSALFLGLWLDSVLGQRGPCTFGVLLLSVPVSLYAMVRIALGAISLIDTQPKEDEREHTTSEKKEV